MPPAYDRIIARTGWPCPHGAVSQSMPIATAYDTLGEEGLKHSLVQTKAKAIYCDPHLLKTLTNPLKEAKELQYIIYNSEGEVKQENIDNLKNQHGHLVVVSFEELRKLGEANAVDPVPPHPEDLWLYNVHLWLGQGRPRASH